MTDYGPNLRTQERTRLELGTSAHAEQALGFISTTMIPREDALGNPLRFAERHLCTCGLCESGFYQTWAISHANGCESRTLFGLPQGTEGEPAP